MNSSQQIELTLDVVGERLDRVLAAVWPDLSRMQWQRLIKEGAVTMNGRSLKASQKVTGGEVVTAVLPEVVESGLEAENIPLDIRYEDDDLILVNKPAGMVVHPSVGHDTGTLVNAILYYCPDIEGIDFTQRPGIVHRLDKYTSGLVVVAKNDRALRYMQAQFKERTIKKKYLALVEGQLTPPAALINAAIGRDPRQRKKMAVIPLNASESARESQTRYETAVTYDDFTLVNCYPLTGRTHQIRVHLAYVGYPIVCDHIYGRRKRAFPQLKRHFLHAAELTFKRPFDDAELTFEAELPSELQAIINQLNC
ncbi:MAG: RNA pseudouridine synthase [Chloroflexi bacterium]|nr:MAG: RNA pseudouridine synthase [Chloroflexota bacterium]PIE81718.1 MAG: RNA pseudouridine synthase [Chloroflexota bacterium]